MPNLFIGPNIVAGGVIGYDLTASGNLTCDENTSRTLVLAGAGDVILPTADQTPGDEFTIYTAAGSAVNVVIGGAPNAIAAGRAVAYAYLGGTWLLLFNQAR